MVEGSLASVDNAARRARAVGYLRVVVGLGLLVAPKTIARWQADEAPTGSLALLIRTVGIRDLVLGVGTVLAAHAAGTDEIRRWLGLGLLSDALDVTAGGVSVAVVGRRGALIAAGVPVPVILSDLWALAALPSRGDGTVA